MHAPSAPVQRIGEVASRHLVAFGLKDQRVPAAMNVNVWEGTDQIPALICSHPRRADADSPLAELVSQRESGQGDV